MMVANYRSVIQVIKKSTEDVEWFYQPIIDLIEGYDWGVSLAYAFSQLERGQKNALYCGMRKIHGVNSDVAWAAIGGEHLTRKDYRERFKVVIGVSLPKEMIDRIVAAEKIRDGLMHGNSPSSADMRKAIVAVIKYSEEMNNLCGEKQGFRPYGKLQGFAGAGRTLSKSTSRLVAKGLGFHLN